jgi:protein-disulfide isomerase
MRCEEVEQDIAEYVAGALPKSRLLDHLAECAGCRNEVAALRETWADLEHIPVPRSSALMQTTLRSTLAAIQAEVDAVRVVDRPLWRTRMELLAKPILLMTIAIGTAFFAGRSLLQPTHEPAVVAGLRAGDAAESHYRGASNAQMTLLEYGDYQCPPCAAYNPVIKSVLRHYGDKLRLEFRQFPLAGVHPNAVQAALAAEAAGEQGRYWEMNDLLFETQPQWARAANPDENFTALAARIGLDEMQFLKGLHSADLERRISADVASAQAAHVEGTPTFFLNGRHINVPAVAVEAFQNAIDAELQRNR